MSVKQPSKIKPMKHLKLLSFPSPVLKLKTVDVDFITLVTINIKLMLGENTNLIFFA